eukprot:9447523-Pyramimonas_sp.AAC.1
MTRGSSGFRGGWCGPGGIVALAPVWCRFVRDAKKCISGGAEYPGQSGPASFDLLSKSTTWLRAQDVLVVVPCTPCEGRDS